MSIPTAGSLDDDAGLRQARFRDAIASVGVMWTNDACGRMTGPQPGWADLTGQSETEYQGLG
jgi:hypothetical protein